MRAVVLADTGGSKRTDEQAGVAECRVDLAVREEAQNDELRAAYASHDDAAVGIEHDGAGLVVHGGVGRVIDDSAVAEARIERAVALEPEDSELRVLPVDGSPDTNDLAVVRLQRDVNNLDARELARRREAWIEGTVRRQTACETAGIGIVVAVEAVTVREITAGCDQAVVIRRLNGPCRTRQVGQECSPHVAERRIEVSRSTPGDERAQEAGCKHGRGSGTAFELCLDSE